MGTIPISPLAKKIAERIIRSKHNGLFRDANNVASRVPCITFHEYMALCLYDAEYGYYVTGSIRVGKEGDFYTSSAVGEVLAEVLARYAFTFSQDQKEVITMAEWGAGTGKLFASIASAGQRIVDDWEERFPLVVVENHPGHADAVYQSFQRAGLLNKPVVLSSNGMFEDALDWFERPILLIANELLDAFPVHRVIQRRGKLLELGVAGSVEGGFFYTEMELTNPSICNWLARDGISLSEGQITEICPEAHEWLLQMGSLIGEGRLVLIDYGHEAAEYSAEHRMEGTVMTYWKHRASDSPFERPGEQDITAHVSFSFIRRSAEEAGFQVIYYDTQKQFLIDYGALDLLRNHDGRDPFSVEVKMNRAVRQLLLSDGMSETFKVMILQK
ncbi:SAM-dependent methyltransferase [Paenibacillus sp. L3-i20]|nr:SAM-dependent methyltransferase [Paenibacillus sp. L3-i20]